MVPLSPSLLIACATGAAAGVSRGPARARGSKHPSGLGLREDLASVAFINGVGYLSHLDHQDGRSSWPVPRMHRVMDLVRFGHLTGVFRDQPALGDIALRWDAKRSAFVHASIVAHLDDGEADIIPIDRSVRCRLLHAQVDGARAESAVLRPGGGDRFLRWADL